MAKKEPLYPHVPGKKESLFPHVTGGQKAGSQFIKVGDRIRYIQQLGRSRRGDWPEGAWLEYGVEGTITEYRPGQPAATVRGEYFEGIEPWAVVTWDNGGTTAIDATDEGEHWERIGSISLSTKSVDLVKAVRETADTLSSSKYIVSKLDSWTPEQKREYIKAYSASDWGVVYDMTSDMGGSQYWRNQTRGDLCDVLKEEKSLDLMAKTEGDPISKYCCRLCGECAPEELLEEGRFLERISWLRQHYKESHPGVWGKGQLLPMTESGPVPPEYRHLASWISEPLPRDAY